MTAHGCTSPGCTNKQHRKSLDELTVAQDKAVIAYGTACFAWGAVKVAPDTDWKAKQDAASAAFLAYMKAREAVADHIKELTR